MIRAVRRQIPPQGAWMVILGIAMLLVWSAMLFVQRPVAVTEAHGPMIPDPPWPDLRLDLNTATGAELRLLPGIGERLSESIVQNRQQSGPFHSVDDLQRVRWIGPRTIERIRPWVVNDHANHREPSSENLQP